MTNVTERQRERARVDDDPDEELDRRRDRLTEGARTVDEERHGHAPMLWLLEG
jgi:hypothetical protein